MHKTLYHISKHCFSILLLLFSLLVCKAQEFNCNVIINSERAQTQEQQIFTDLKIAISDFINNKAWTNHQYSTEEKINCNLLLNVTQITNSSRFTCNAQIQFTRPVYGVNYETPMINIVDNNFNFSYSQGQNLIFNENTFSSNLTSLLAFYAYIILALDYDSFSPKGGSTFIEKAFNILNNAQSASFEGWTESNGPNNRYFLIDHLNSTQFASFRTGMYNYHRRGMDVLATNPKEARKQIMSMIENIRKVQMLQPISFLIKSFFFAKSTEIIDVFTVASRDEKQKVFTLLRRIDPQNTQKYQKIMTNR